MTEIFWLALAFAGGLLSHRLGLPVFVGYLLAGAGLALSGAESTDALHHIGELGVLLLLFGVGLHIRLENLLSRAVLIGGGLHLLISTGLFALAAVLVGVGWKLGAVLGLVLSFSSTVLAAKDLEQRNELSSFHGRVAIGILILQDLAAVSLLLVLGSEPLTWWAILPLLVLPFVKPLLSRLLDGLDSAELQMLFAVVATLGGAELFKYVGLSAELGALVMGALFADHIKGDELGERLWALKELFLVGFFVYVGMTAQLSWNGVLFAIPVLLILPAKSMLYFLLLVANRLRARTAFLAGASLTSYSEFSLIAGAVAVNAGLIDAEFLGALAMVTALSFAINLPIDRFGNRIYWRFEAWFKRFERNVQHPDDQTKSLGQARYMVLGMGRTGAAAYSYLQAHGKKVVGVDVDPLVIERELNAGHRVAYGDVLDHAFWTQLHISQLAAVVICVPNLQARVSAVRELRAKDFTGRISVFALDHQEDALLCAAGVDAICHVTTESGMRLAELATKATEDDHHPTWQEQLTDNRR